jgi:4'-phosphopantetheinyl transferase EntD
MPLPDLFGPDTACAEGAATRVDGELYPEELALIGGASAARHAEFGTARVCARKALSCIGVAPAPLIGHEGNGPVWPAGTVGSIAHTRGHCAVVVGRRPPLRSLGLDVELLRPLEPGVVDLVLTERERAWLEAQPAALRGDLAVTFFSAKEAYYKCQHPLTGVFLDFKDVEVDLRPGDGTFEARAVGVSLPADVARLGGRFVHEDGRVVCGVELRG